MGEVAEGADFVDTETDNLQVGQLPDERDVVDVTPPQIYVLDVFEIVLFALFDDDFSRQRV